MQKKNKSDVKSFVAVLFYDFSLLFSLNIMKRYFY